MRILRLYLLLLTFSIPLKLMAQMSNHYALSSFQPIHKDGKYGHLSLYFCDSVLKTDTFWVVAGLGGQQSLSQIYSDLAGKPRLYNISHFRGNDHYGDHVFLYPDSLVYVPPDTFHGFVDFIHRNDSTYWMLEGGHCDKYINFHTGQVSQVDLVKLYDNWLLTDYAQPMFLHNKQSQWLVHFTRENGKNPRYYTVLVDAEGIKKGSSGVLITQNSKERESFDWITSVTWNAQKSQMAWIMNYRYSIEQFYVEKKELWTADFDTLTGEMANISLQRKDSFQYKPSSWAEPGYVVNANYFVQSVAYSPNGEYLYELETYPLPKLKFHKGRLLQHHLSSGKTEVIADARPNHLDSVFVGSRLHIAPNGKIYMFFGNGTQSWSQDHEISYTDKKGKACGFQKVAQTSHFNWNNSYSKPYYEKRANIGQLTPCTDEHRFVNNGHQSFKNLLWHFFDMDSNLLHSVAGDSILCPKLPVGPHLVLLRGEDPKGFVNWHWDSFYYSPPVTARIQLLDSVACEFNQIRFADSSVNFGPDDALSWNWEFRLNNQLLQTSADQHPQVAFTKEGDYSISLHFSNGICADSTTLNNALSIKDGPKPGFSISDTLVCAPATISVLDSSSGSIAKRSFSWSDGFTANKNHSRKFDEPRAYQVLQNLEGPNGCKSADSHKLRIRPGIRQLGRPHLLRTTVAGHGQVQIDWDTIGLAHSYTLWRMQDSASDFKIPIANPTQKTYTDVGPETHIRSYQYQLNPIDSCGNEGWRSNLGTSLWLHATNQQNKVVVLRWNAYESWANGVSEYVVESSENGEDWLPIDGLRELTYPDYRLPNLDTDTLWYRIKATEQDGRRQQSFSNVVKVLATNTLFIPNAFSPNGDGINDVFKIGSFGLTHITCTVFARNGQIASYSTDPDMLWDGTLMGETVPVGAYTYILRAVNSKGKPVEVNGVVVVVR